MSEYSNLVETLDGDFHFAYKDSASTEKRAAHIHRDFEILYVLSDKMLCQINESIYPIMPNTLLLFNNMDLHCIVSSSDADRFRRYVISFKPEFISDFSTADADLLHCFYFRPFTCSQQLPLSAQEAFLMEDLLERFSSTDSGQFADALNKKLLFGQILIQINRFYLSHHNLQAGFSAKYRSIFDVISFIHSHYADPLSLDLLSSKFFISKPHLCVLFRQVTGTTPAQYITNCRIMQAKSLLSAGYGVDDVCGCVGFSSLSHFSHIFKAHTGISPKRYQMQALLEGGNA